VLVQIVLRAHVVIEILALQARLQRRRGRRLWAVGRSTARRQKACTGRSDKTSAHDSVSPPLIRRGGDHSRALQCARCNARHARHLPMFRRHPRRRSGAEPELNAGRAARSARAAVFSPLCPCCCAVNRSRRAASSAVCRPPAANAAPAAVRLPAARARPRRVPPPP
jgi:hypothetical protein